MKTLILNGSPKGEKGNSQIFASHFVKGTGKDYEIVCITKADVQELAEKVKHYNTLIFVLPLYVHAIPGMVMKLLDLMEPQAQAKQAMGLIIQSGFMEAAQSRYAVRYFEQICRHLGCRCMGTVIKGGAAGVYLMPERMNKKLFASLEELGRYYEQTGEFSADVINELGKEYELSRGKARFQQFLFKTGIGNLFWISMLKKHKAYSERFARPFQ